MFTDYTYSCWSTD